MSPIFDKKDKPSPLCQSYRDATRVRLPKKTEAATLRFVSIDCETSGFKVGTDRVLSLAAFEIQDGQIDIAGAGKWIVYQPKARLNQATAVHGILPEETQQGTPEQDILPELLPILSGAIIVGHHVRFDAAMLNDILMRHCGIRFCNRLVDTGRMAMNELVAFHQSGYANQRPPALEEVCAQLNVPPVARHTAEGDAFTTAEVFLMLCSKIRKRLKRPLQLRDLPVTKF